MNDDITINAKLEQYHPPAPSRGLQDRILAAADASPQSFNAANDNPRRWKVPAAIAASLVAAVFAASSMSGETISADDEAWQVAATETGFADLYAWVYGEG